MLIQCHQKLLQQLAGRWSVLLSGRDESQEVDSKVHWDSPSVPVGLFLRQIEGCYEHLEGFRRGAKGSRNEGGMSVPNQIKWKISANDYE